MNAADFRSFTGGTRDILWGAPLFALNQKTRFFLLYPSKQAPSAVERESGRGQYFKDQKLLFPAGWEFQLVF